MFNVFKHLIKTSSGKNPLEHSPKGSSCKVRAGAQTTPDVTHGSASDSTSTDIIACCSGKLIDATTLPDPVFAQKMLGETCAIAPREDTITVYSPSDGSVSALFPTGHAFGITRPDGVEILVHIGINTVEAHGEGLRVLDVRQGDTVKAGKPMVEVDVKKLSQTYNMSIMTIITDAQQQSISFKTSGSIHQGDSIIA
ncbi:glucose PTS transporter subunit IIA [Fannyhessea vaginae]|uniref:PTS sugar transporter subunit IIA n=1 Tax=Fannyhessea vaginae TaxID=82135 RepID=UPI0023EF6FC6|nr:glucose PTS transporter subunit IIA [Fannyhessea vaginae]